MLEFVSFAITPVEFVLFLMAFAAVAGAVGAIFGLGGGIFMVPVMVVLFGVDIQTAIVASLVSVIATSSGSAASYVREGLADLRVSMFLEVSTVIGGIAGALASVLLLAGRSQILAVIFAPVVIVSAILMYRTRDVDVRPEPPRDPWAERLKLRGEYYDVAHKQWEEYRVTGTQLGLVVAAFAGVLSSLLGIGGGLFYVPAMNAGMNVPFRVASASSNFMIGVTATAGALVYLFSGHLAVGLAAPVAIGILAGSFLGARMPRTARTRSLKGLFAGILGLAALVMLLRGLGLLH